jgi:DNA ligase-associated metallophosphoesterase
VQEIFISGSTLQLLPEKAVYLQDSRSLLVADVHLGKSETFQKLGIPIPNRVNQETIDRLKTLCTRLQPAQMIILGDLFHSRLGLVAEVFNAWSMFLASVEVEVKLIVGNHDRALTSQLQQFSMEFVKHAIQLENLWLSHEPDSQSHNLNICGHIHPYLKIKNRLDNFRLPCFYLDANKKQLMLPSFGSFTGGYEVQLTQGVIAYVIAENSVIPFAA